MEETDYNNNIQTQNGQMIEQNPIQHQSPPEQTVFQKLEYPLQASQLQRQELSQIKLLIKDNKWKDSIPLLQTYLENKFDPQIQIDGLGNYEVALGYYQCFPYSWYIQGVTSGKYKGTACDLLSLCYLALRLDDQSLWKGIDWYKKMMQKYEDRYQFTFGYANAINNQGYYDEAVEYYIKTIGLKPNFLPAYECIIYVYQYKRIQVPKSIEWARKALEIDSNSIYAQFVLAKNEKDPDRRIQKVKEVVEKFPKYSRAVNFVGFIYGETKKMPEEAIIWHKKAVEAIPMFDIGNYNVGMRCQQLQDYKQAIYWYIEANRFDKDYRLPCDKLVPIFQKLGYSQEQIEQQVKKHDVRIDYFYFNIGKSYYDMGKTELSLKYYFKAESVAKQLKNELFRVYNSIGNTYFKKKDYDRSIQAFNKAITINPKCDMVYYNMANVYKEMHNVQEAKKYHKKSNEVNPRYAYPYNNLGNIYVDERNYDQAIKCYKNAVKYKSNYVLAMANLGVCYLKVHNYRDAFVSISRAKQLLEANIKDLSEGNKVFLRETLDKLDKQGENWRKNGGIDLTIIQRIKGHIQEFQGNFHRLYKNSQKQSVHLEKIMKKQIFEIALILYDTQFDLSMVGLLFDLVKQLFKDNQEYFHIIPQIIVHSFYQSAVIQQKPIKELESKLTLTITQLLKQNIKFDPELHKKDKLKDFRFSHFELTDLNTPCQFKNSRFKDFAELEGEILRINDKARDCYKEYKQLVNKIRTQSKGIPYGVLTRIPKQGKEQFKQIIRIVQKLYKIQLDDKSLDQIKHKITQTVASKSKINKIYWEDCDNIFNDIKKIWVQEINQIIKARVQNNIETVCSLNDLLTGKILFASFDQLRSALVAADQLCFQKGHTILSMENRLNQEQNQDVVLTIKVRETICELQLAMQQDETHHNFVTAIKEIEQSPFGCIFGSYIYMSKRFNYPFLQNCRDIFERLQEPGSVQQRRVYEAIRYVIAELSHEFAT